MKQAKKSTIQTQATFIIQQINNMPTAVPIVIDLDKPLHTAENGYRCNDATCPCNAETVEDIEEYPIAHRSFTYDIPEAGNGRKYRTTSSRVDWD